jgi:hypothetical protein
MSEQSFIYVDCIASTEQHTKIKIMLYNKKIKIISYLCLIKEYSKKI